jgi:formylglycine-generating enzyme required for sulfatase activity
MKFEYGLAHELGHKIFPVILHTLTIKDVPELLVKYQIGLNVETDGYKATLLRLVKELPRSFIVSEMLPVSAGPFLMGPDSPKEINLPTFWIGKTSVTVAEYACFLESKGYETGDYWLGDTLAIWSQNLRDNCWARRNLKEYAIEHPKQPMRGLSWYEAYAYCQWLSVVTDHPFMLPTEAQWEKAARGTDQRMWAFGNEWKESAADVRDYRDVKRLDPKDCGIPGSESPFGCQDMIGQVWNWMLSVKPALPVGNDDPEMLVKDLDAWRIIRGGSWLHGRDKAKTYHGECQPPIPDDYRYEIGLRLVTPKDPIGVPKSG